ncbi:MAG: hypothetical protein ABIF10_00575 [Candidatus Woesearchaeota archaeon]
MKVSKDRPLAEITLRKYEKPYGLKGRELAKKLCLSIGLLQPGDSRDVIADILHVLMNEKKELTAREIEALVIESRKQHNVPLHGIAPSNIRRQLKRLKNMFLIESLQNRYRIAEKSTLIEIFEEKIERFYLQSILNRVKEYFKAI